MKMIEEEILCPSCKSPIRWDDTYEQEIEENEGKLVLYKTGTCLKCKKTVDYGVSYQLKDKKIDIFDHY